MDEKKASETLKFLCSYNGKIVLPRHGGADGKLRYSGGLTRVLAVDRSISFAELMVKIGEFCGFSATLRCQLPGGDLETLISITSNDDLANLVEEYERASSFGKIRAILSPRKSIKTVSPPPSATHSVNFAPRRPPPFAAAVPAPKFFVPAEPVPRFFVPDAPARFFGAPAMRRPGGGKQVARSFLGRCNVEEKPNRVLHQQALHHYHHHNQGVPRSYYWQ